jgi:hypothetical protein
MSFCSFMENSLTHLFVKSVGYVFYTTFLVSTEDLRGRYGRNFSESIVMSAIRKEMSCKVYF